MDETEEALEMAAEMLRSMAKRPGEPDVDPMDKVVARTIAVELLWEVAS